MLLDQLFQREFGFVVLFDVSFSLSVVRLIHRHHHHNVHRSLKLILLLDLRLLDSRIKVPLLPYKPVLLFHP